jgi:choline dehydrogenase-like flavoprotein
LGQFHRRPGLFAGIFPRPCRPNPMVTVIAVAARNHRHLVERRAEHGI